METLHASFPDTLITPITGGYDRRNFTLPYLPLHTADTCPLVCLYTLPTYPPTFPHLTDETGHVIGLVTNW